MDYPFVRILGFYLFGCIIASHIDVGAATVLISLLAGCGLLSFTWIWGWKQANIGWWLAFALIALGLVSIWIATLPDELEGWVGKEVSFEGFIAYQPQLASDASSAILIAQIAYKGKRIRRKVWFTVRESLPEIRYGVVYAGMGEIRRPPPQRNPGGYDQQTALARKGVRVILFADEYELVPKQRGCRALHWLDRVRNRVETLLEASVHRHPEHAAVLRGILLGQRKRIPESTLEPIQTSGLLHLFAVSGLHVGFLAGTVYLLLGFARPLPDRFKISITMVVVLIYAGLVGFRPSVVRATLMVELVLFARWIYRDHNLINLLALAAWILLAWNPWMLSDVGFQLSFLATASILVFVPRWWQSILDRWELPRSIALVIQTVLVSLAAQLASQPLIAYYFFRVYPIALFSNLGAALLAWWIVVTSFLAVLGGALWMPIAGFVGYATQAGLIILIQFTRWISALPGSMISVTRSQAIALFTLPLVTVAVTYWRWFYGRWRYLVGFACLWFTVMLWWGVWPQPFPGLEVTFLDVGQGDAICVRFPDHKVLLIDTGPRNPTYDAGKSILAPYLLHENIRSVDAVLITHSERDHTGGLEYLQGHFRIREILGNENPPSLGKLTLSDSADIEVIHPSPAFLESGNHRTNDLSVVLRIRFGGVSFLFTGDIESKAETQICNEVLELKATVLKVAHHGSRTSSSQTFLNATDPQIAVISCGRNRGGRFPSFEVLTRLKELGLRLYRTDQSGAIRIRTDGRACWIDTFIKQ